MMLCLLFQQNKTICQMFYKSFAASAATYLEQIWQNLLCNFTTDGAIFNEAHHFSELICCQLQRAHVNLALLKR